MTSFQEFFPPVAVFWKKPKIKNKKKKKKYSDVYFGQVVLFKNTLKPGEGPTACIRRIERSDQ